MIGVQRGLDVYVLDHNDHPQTREMVRSLGAAYHAGRLEDFNGHFKPDILMECSGAPSVIRDVLGRTAPGARQRPVFGTVNANRTHYELAGEALQRADKAWLNRLITRREPLERWTRSLERQPDDIKVIVDFS